MIAPIESLKASASSPGIRRARRLVACTLLKLRSSRPDCAASAPAWRAWLFTTWVALVVAVYFACMAGLL